MFRIVCIISVLSFSFQVLSSQEIVTDELINAGLGYLRNGETESASDTFREVLADPVMVPFHPEALYWLVKTDIALQMYDEASRAADRFILEHKDHGYFPEMRYQRGRLLYLEDDPENAIIGLGNFVRDFPDSGFVPSAYYWIGESLTALGRLEEADAVYSQLLKQYPSSVKREAARHRRSEISLMYRERELLNLLKWSHEEYLQDAEHFYRIEAEYSEAAAEYMAKLKGGSPGDLQNLYRNHILDAKQRLLELQEFYIDELLELSYEN